MTAPVRLIDQFAEALSESGDVDTAARQVGIVPAYGRVLLQRIINRLGKAQCK